MSPLKIAVFDIDGTLTETNEVDNRLYADSLRSVFGIEGELDLLGFDEVTDSAILRRLWERRRDRAFAEVESDMKELFFEALADAAAADAGAFSATPGAPSVFDLVRGAGWTPAIATGCWRQSAILKLRAAGIDVRGVPLVSASDFLQRHRIIQQAILDAGGDTNDPVVHVGDGVWDVRASRELGIGFVGRAEREHAVRLRAHGASSVVADFVDTSRFLAELEGSARSPWNAV